MPVFKKKVAEPKEEKPFNPPALKLDKAEDVCVVEGCMDSKAPGQTHVCAKHVRTN